MSTQIFIANGTFTWPAGVTTVTAECIGGGGGGGIASGNPSTGGGGKGGSYAKAVITKGAETTLAVVVGAAGAIAAAGGLSSVTQASTVRCAASGGGGGATQATVSANGAGGTTLNGTSVGTVINAGGNGGTGSFTPTTGRSGAGGGAGGPTSVGGAASAGTAGTAGTGIFADGVVYQGAGAAGVGDTTVGAVGVVAGGGGSGGKANTNPDKDGGLGARGVVVLTWPDPPTTINRVNNTTGTLTTGSTAAPFTLTLPSTPTVGNGMILWLRGSYSSGIAPFPPMTFLPGMVTDNQGNYYELATCNGVTGVLNYAQAIYYCPRITAASGTFTISVDSGDGITHFWSGGATEFTGLGGGSLSVYWVSIQGNSANTTAVQSGGIGLLKGEVLLAAVMGTGTNVNQASITPEVVGPPTWRKEVEVLTGATFLTMSGLSRITSFDSTNAAANWTLATAASYGACIVAFQLRAPDPTRLARVSGSGDYGASGYWSSGASNMTVAPHPRPRLGSALALVAMQYAGAGLQCTFPATTTDNAGNVYDFIAGGALTGTPNAYGVAIYLCPKITKVSVPSGTKEFAIIFIAGPAGSNLTGGTVEIGGLGSKSVIVAGTSTYEQAGGNPAASNWTPPMTGRTVLVAGVNCTTNLVTYINGEAGWLQEFERIPTGGPWCEANSREMDLVEQSVQMTWDIATGSSYWRGVIVGLQLPAIPNPQICIS